MTKTIPINNPQSVYLRSYLRKPLKMYENDWDDLLIEELRKQFVPEVFDKLNLLPDTSQNIFRRIIREISTIYLMPAHRVFSGSSEAAQKIYSDLSIDTVLLEAHRLSKAATVVFILVSTDEKEKITLQILTPDQCYVETSPYNPAKITGFAYRCEAQIAGKKILYWNYFSEEEHLYLDLSGAVLDKSPVTGKRYARQNIFGCIPVAPLHASTPVRSFWNPYWNKDAYTANMVIGINETHSNYLVHWQSFKQIWLSGAETSAELKDAILDPAYPLNLGDSGKVGVLDLTSDALHSIEEKIENKVIAIANNYGISTENFTVTRTAQSALALSIKRQSLEEVRRQDTAICQQLEKAIFNVVRSVANVYAHGPSERIPLEETLSMEPVKVSDSEFNTRLGAQWRFEINNNISSPIDYYLTKFPSLTRDEAEKAIIQRKIENERIRTLEAQRPDAQNHSAIEEE